jgi:hypothetical protein
MTRRTPRSALLAALLLASALPTHAQDDTSSVRFDGVGFEFAHSLGRSVNIIRVPRQRLGSVGVGEADPAHITFSIYPRMAESRRPPRAWDVPGAVRVYATSGLEGFPFASRQLERLQELLAARPDPATLESITDEQTVDLPYLPIEGAAQAIAARIDYIDTPELSGIAYVTGFRQDLFPFARDDFWYTFQGMSTDGQWYVSVSWIVRATMFPARVSDADARRVGRNARTWERYIRESVGTLAAAEPTAFRPSLDTLDALVRSIDFESVVQASPSPSLEPSPTAEPPPSALPSTEPPPNGVPASEGPGSPTVAPAASTAP